MRCRHFVSSILGLILGLAFGVAHAGDGPVKLRLHMPDGQLLSHLVRVYVPDRVVTSTMHPELCLARLGNISIDNAGELKCGDADKYSPDDVAPGQQWKGTERLEIGSLLLFDLSKYYIPFYQSGRRVLPILRWSEPEPIGGTGTESANKLQAVSPKVIYLANRVGTLLWTFVVLAFFLTVTWWLVRKDEKGVWGLLSYPDGRLSVSLTQMAIWTVAVGGVVLGYGFMRLEVPTIPQTLVWLMGLSATTSGVGH